MALLVQRLKVTCPTMGRRRMARILARCTLHLGATTVQRMVKAWRPREADTGTATTEAKPAAPRRIFARAPDHTWHVDLTEVPINGGFWVPWPPFSMVPRHPFTWWIATVVDHFSRLAKGFALFPSEPTAVQVCRFLDGIVQATGKPPKYIISDQGPQFDSDDYRHWCESKDPKIKPRFGAIGKYGSIAVVERFIRSMKEESLRRILVPAGFDQMRHELNLYFTWYNQFRPHEYLAGRTPAEVYSGLQPANIHPRIEPRPRWPSDSKCANPQAPVRGSPGARFTLSVSYLEGREHLPIVSLEDAA